MFGASVTVASQVNRMSEMLRDPKYEGLGKQVADLYWSNYGQLVPWHPVPAQLATGQPLNFTQQPSSEQL